MNANQIAAFQKKVAKQTKTVVSQEQMNIRKFILSVIERYADNDFVQIVTVNGKNVVTSPDDRFFNPSTHWKVSSLVNYLADNRNTTDFYAVVDNEEIILSKGTNR